MAEASKQTTSDDNRKKAKVFFDRGAAVAASGSYNYAIEMYISGLMLDPESVPAHEALRELSLKRKAGGKEKGLGVRDMITLRLGSKDDKVAMLNAEKLLAYDPGNTDHMQTMMQAAHKGGFVSTVMWLGPIFFLANTESKKPDFNKYMALMKIYKDLSEWKLAQEAGLTARRLKPEDMELDGELKRLAALQTMRDGNYEGGSDFRGSIRNAGEQTKLLNQDKDFHDADVVAQQIQDAEKDFATNPNDPGKLSKLVDALAKTEHFEEENRAIELLQAAYDRTKQFRWKMRIGEINMRQWSRMVRNKKTELDKDPRNPQLQQEYNQLRIERYEYELSQYREWSDAYPTEMNHRFEMGKRLFLLRRFEESIPAFQAASNDPKLKIKASLSLGRAFFEAKYMPEAAEILGNLINEYPLKGDERSREMYYWRGRALEEMGQAAEAIKLYSQLTQWEFSYMDVQARLKALRAALAAGGPKAS